MKSEDRKSAEIRKIPISAVSIALSISDRQPVPAAIRRSSHSSRSPSTSDTRRWVNSRSFQTLSLWL
jgi:hypothetical protein